MKTVLLFLSKRCKKSVVSILIVSILFAGCQQEIPEDLKTPGNLTSAFNMLLLKNKLWVEYYPKNPTYTPSMKFRFFNSDTLCNYHYISSIFPVEKYDSIVNCSFKITNPPDTVSVYGGGLYRGGMKIFSLNDTLLTVHILSYVDTSYFKAVK
jgi:hypothetical protein